MSAAANFFKNRAVQKEILQENKRFQEEGAKQADVSGKVRFHVAVQGCAHGELDAIYELCRRHEAEGAASSAPGHANPNKIDLLICCGDFQAVRRPADMGSMAVPDKYKTLGDFPHYYYHHSPAATSSLAQRTQQSPRVGGTDTSAASPAPYLTVFIGGNHENSDWLAECSYGEFLAPNIYYLGHSGVIEAVKQEEPTGAGQPAGERRRRAGVMRIAGLSGIFKGHDYRTPYPGRPYYSPHGGGGAGGRGDAQAVKSAYHVRRIEMEKLRCYTLAREHLRCRAAAAPAEGTGARRAPLHLFLSHDWPAGVTAYGDEAALLRTKPYFSDDVRHRRLGNPLSLEMLLRPARPLYWLSAHLHVFFRAVVHHPAVAEGDTRGDPQCAREASTTTFIALDKCLCGEGGKGGRGRDLGAAAANAASNNTGTRTSLDFIDVYVDAADEEAEEEAGETGEAAGVALRHDDVWLSVLRHSHAFLSRNHCADDDDDGARPSPSPSPASAAVGFGVDGGFNARRAAVAVADEHAAAALVSASPSPPPLRCTTTGAVLAHLGLPRSLPLQVAPDAGAGGAPDASGHHHATPPPTGAHRAAPLPLEEAGAPVLDGADIDLPWAEDLGS